MNVHIYKVKCDIDKSSYSESNRVNYNYQVSIKKKRIKCYKDIIGKQNLHFKTK